MVCFHTFEDVMAYLRRFTDYERMTGVRYGGRTYNLARMRRLVTALGHPERGFPSIHIAGTKGKGSTAIMTEAILRAHGLRTGLYTSPHLVDLLERIQLNGKPISRRQFVKTIESMRRVITRLRPTFFEIMTAAAFRLFQRARVDGAVIEVGLGGRLDATNVVTPVACGITRIDYDHVETLGRRLAQIAGEKAGIIKPGVPVITSEMRPVARQVILRRAREVGAPILEPQEGAVPSTLGTRGAHQRENAAVAIVLAGQITHVRSTMIRRVLTQLRIPGRVEEVRPGWFVDVAHNPLAMRATADALPKARSRRIVVFGASRDKNWKAMMRILPADFWILTRADNPRACPPDELARFCPGPHVTIGSVSRALRVARKMAAKRDQIIVTGSFYVAGEALRARLGE